MKKAKLTLEDYIKEYAAKNSVTDKSPSGKKTLANFSDAIRSLLTSAKMSSAGYGARAEQLSSLGLSGSGYGDYLKTKTENILLSKLGTLENKKIKTNVKADAAHLAYIEQYEKEKAEAEKEYAARQESLKNKLTSYAKTNGITDYDELYKYGIASGLSEENAKVAAERGVREAKNKIRLQNIEKAQSVIISKHLTKTQAYEYAVTLGLSEEDAKSLAEFAYKINQDTDYIAGDIPEPETSVAKPPKKPSHSNNNIHYIT